jgi:hypothetical protein
MGDCQLRDGQGQTPHMYLFMLAYSLFMRQLRQHRARDGALRRLKTIGEACRAMPGETPRATLAQVIQQVRNGENDCDHVFAKLRLVSFAKAQFVKGGFPCFTESLRTDCPHSLVAPASWLGICRCAQLHCSYASSPASPRQRRCPSEETCI